jgi:branched-chain amino acid transport system substrate-binding protein
MHYIKIASTRASQPRWPSAGTQRPQREKQQVARPGGDHQVMLKTGTKILASLPALALAAGLAGHPAVAADCEVKIGSVGPLSGGASAFGLANKAASELQAALVNEAGGLQVGDKKCHVTIVVFDAQYTAAGGAASANYLASENVHITMGPVGSPETTGFRPIAKRAGIINFSSSYMGGVITPEFPLAFHALQAPVTWGPILVKEAKNRFNFKTVMIVGANDQGGTDASKQLAKMYADNGVKATEEYYQRGTTNFGPLATRIMNANPDGLEVATMGPGDVEVLIKQLTDAGFTGVIGALGGAGKTPVIQGAGGIDKLKNFYWLETMPVDEPGVAVLNAEWRRVMKSEPPAKPLFVVFSVSMEQAMRAISLAGTDQDAEKIAAALRTMTPESKYLGKGGWRGKTIYDINQELAFPVGLGLVVNGKQLGVQRVEIPSE